MSELRSHNHEQFNPNDEIRALLDIADVLLTGVPLDTEEANNGQAGYRSVIFPVERRGGENREIIISDNVQVGRRDVTLENSHNRFVGAQSRVADSEVVKLTLEDDIFSFVYDRSPVFYFDGIRQNHAQLEAMRVSSQASSDIELRSALLEFRALEGLVQDVQFSHVTLVNFKDALTHVDPSKRQVVWGGQFDPSQLLG